MSLIQSQSEPDTQTNDQGREIERQDNKARFAIRQSAGRTAPSWYQNPGPWWYPEPAIKSVKTDWVKKYKAFVKPPAGVLPVYTPFYGSVG